MKQNETLPGGNAPIYSSTIFRMDDGAKLTPDKDFGINGCVVSVSNVKSRSGVSGGESATDLVFNYITGFDPDLSLYLMLKNANKVNGAGAYLYFGDRTDMKFSQKNFKNKLATEPEFMNVFVEEAFNHLRGELEEMERLRSMPVSQSTSMLMDRIRALNTLK